MTDRHLHCVYFQYTNPNDAKGHCLLKDEDILMGYAHCCEYIVLRPVEILSYFLKHEQYCEDWECADKKALTYIKKAGFNTYPKGELKMSEIITLNEKQLNFLINCIAKAMATNTNRPNRVINEAESYMKNTLKKLGEEE